VYRALFSSSLILAYEKQNKFNKSEHNFEREVVRKFNFNILRNILEENKKLGAQLTSCVAEKDENTLAKVHAIHHLVMIYI
jgi:hypothetical protein